MVSNEKNRAEPVNIKIHKVFYYELACQLIRGEGGGYQYDEKFALFYSRLRLVKTNRKKSIGKDFC